MLLQLDALLADPLIHAAWDWTVMLISETQSRVHWSLRRHWGALFGCQLSRPPWAMDAAFEPATKTCCQACLRPPRLAPQPLAPVRELQHEGAGSQHFSEARGGLSPGEGLLAPISSNSAAQLDSFL